MRLYLPFLCSRLYYDVLAPSHHTHAALVQNTHMQGSVSHPRAPSQHLQSAQGVLDDKQRPQYPLLISSMLLAISSPAFVSSRPPLGCGACDRRTQGGGGVKKRAESE